MMISRVCLLADLGGTNVRFKLVSLKIGPDGVVSRDVIDSSRYSSNKFRSLEDAILTFLAERTPDHYEWPTVACMCVAGPVENQRAVITALGWVIESHNIEKTLHISKCHIFNDFVSVGYGILSLENGDLDYLNDKRPKAKSTIAVLGPGTGLGEAFLTTHPTFTSSGTAPTDDPSNAASNQEYTVYPTEGGHCTFPATTMQQFQLIDYVARENKISHVSTERVASGSGLPSIYKFLKGIPAENSFDDEYKYINAAYINETARNESDEVSIETVKLFIKILAVEAGNLCLKTLPFGGLYVAGGLGVQFAWAIEKYKFADLLTDKGRMKSVLTNIPVILVKHADVGLLGCEHYACRLLKNIHPFPKF